jgi:hypothetical protein
MKLLEAGVGFTTDRFGGSGLNGATAGSGISVQSQVNGFAGLTASKLGTDIITINSSTENLA